MCLKRTSHEEHRRVPHAPRQGKDERGHTSREDLLQARKSEGTPAKFLAQHDKELTEREEGEGARRRKTRQSGLATCIREEPSKGQKARLGEDSTAVDTRGAP